MATNTPTKRNTAVIADTLTISGNISAPSYNNTNWDTAYSWGDHSTQNYATQGYVTTQLNNLVDSAPGTLDTLNELAAALGDDPNFAATVSANIGAKVSKSGDTMTGTLTVPGVLKITEAGTAQHLLIGNQDSAGANKPAMVRGVNGQLQLGHGDSWSGEGGTMTVGLALSDGKVGIGITNPTDILEISKNSTSGQVVTYRNQTGAFLHRIYADYNNDGTFTEFQTRVGSDGNRTSVGNFSNHDFALRTNNNDRIVIKNGGNVGIGTGSAATKLHIYKDVGYTASTDLLRLEGYTPDFGTTPASVNLLFKFQDSNNTTNEARIKMATVNDTDYGDNDEAASNLIFETTNGGVASDKMIITGRGHIGMGTNNPADPLHVGGRIRSDASMLSNLESISGNTHNFDVFAKTTAYNLYNTRSSTNAPPMDYGTMLTLGSGKAGGTFATQLAHERSSNQLFMRGMNDGANAWSSWQRVFADNYHPNADKWTTARTNTVTLTGDVSGSGSASVDGTGNWTVSIPAVVANNSHSHDYLPVSGSWYGDLGSNGYTRYNSVSSAGGVISFVTKNSQMSTIMDGAYLSYESANGFFGSYNSVYGNLTGIQATAANTLTVKQLDGGVGNLDITGGLTISGNLARGTYESLSQYHTGADNIVLKGNNVGRSGIFFESEKDGTNINHASDFGFIQYHAYGTGTTGESNELIIGVSNDADDHVILNAPNMNGLKFRAGLSNTDYTVWHSGNFTPSNYLTSYTETDTLQSVCGRGNTTNTEINTTSSRVTINTGSAAYFTADGGTNQWKYLSLRTNGSTKWDIATKDNDLSGALQFRVAGASTTRMTLDTSGNLNVPGLLTATQKSFTIDHPTKEGHKLRYGSLEGPENGVYVRGRLKDDNTIELPEYWSELVHEDSITVDVTSIGRQHTWVEDFNTSSVTVGTDGETVNCFYVVYGERKDVEKLVTEFQEVEE